LIIIKMRGSEPYSSCGCGIAPGFAVRILSRLPNTEVDTDGPCVGVRRNVLLPLARSNPTRFLRAADMVIAAASRVTAHSTPLVKLAGSPVLNNERQPILRLTGRQADRQSVRQAGRQMLPHTGRQMLPHTGRKRERRGGKREREERERLGCVAMFCVKLAVRVNDHCWPTPRNGLGNARVFIQRTPRLVSAIHCKPLILTANTIELLRALHSLLEYTQVR